MSGIDMQTTQVSPTNGDKTIEEVSDEQYVELKHLKPMLIAKIQDNAPAEYKVATKLNNSRVEDLFEKLVIPLVRINAEKQEVKIDDIWSSSFRANEIWRLWTLYYDGLVTRRAPETPVCHLPEPVFNKYKEYLKKPIEDLHTLGAAWAIFSFQAAETERILKLAEAKLKYIYTSDDPVEWYVNDIEHKKTVAELDTQVWDPKDREEARRKIEVLVRVRVTTDN